MKKKYRLVPLKDSAFDKCKPEDYSKLPFYQEIKAAIENPSMVVEVEWPEGQNVGQISTGIIKARKAFPKARIRTSFRESLRERGVFQIMYGGKNEKAMLDVGEPDQEFGLGTIEA